jgi:NAD(P)-dependent dehydrogenase (short-subunit alcohol dehydrogenase family)
LYVTGMAWYSSFAGKVVLVTGASSGIGQATALAFAAAGAHVVLAARRRRALQTVATMSREHGVEALVVTTDVTRATAVRACFRQAIERFGRIDVVVNNAGLLIPAAVTAMRTSDLNAMLRVNLFGSLFVMQSAVRQMQQQDGGSIVNVASLAGRRGIPPFGGYCATKFALVGLTEALRTELHGSNVHVSLVLPGVVDTPMVSDALLDPEFVDLWPSALNMPPSWVVWAIFAAVRFQLVEISVPPGTATLEKLAALAPGVADSLVHWSRQAMHWLSTAFKTS